MTGHTPTPWRAKYDDIFSADKELIASAYIMKCSREDGDDAASAIAGEAAADANAAFIVLAVNSHDDLVAALEEIERHSNDSIARGRARAALAKERGET